MQLLTHEVNTPLAIVRGNLHRLQNRHPNAPLVAAANQETRRMSRLFDRLVVLARVDEQLQSELPLNLNASEPIQRWWKDAPGEAQRRVHRSSCGNRAHLNLKVALEYQFFSMLLGELVDNALRFSNANTPVNDVVQGSLQHRQPSLFVVDHEQGLDQEVLKAGFEAFRKSERGRHVDRSEGSGLVLDLDATVVSKPLSLFHIHSNPRGTAALIRLPLATHDGVQATSAATNPEQTSTKLTGCPPELERALSRLLG
ncbi:MAG: sensor protein [Cyanobacteriota bacterium]